MNNIKRIATLAVASVAFAGASVAAASPASAGTSAISGATVFSDSTVTAPRSQSGRVELRAGSSVKQIAAGGQDTAG